MPDRVLIAGAGPTGLALAENLARYDVSCRIIDRGPGPTGESRALALQARTLESFPREITERLLAQGQRIERAELFEGDRHLARLELTGAPTPHPFALGLSQSKIEKVLIGRLEELGISVEWNTALEDIVSNDDDGVEVEWSNGEGHFRERTDWLVACDGVHSQGRRAADIGIEEERDAHWFLMGDVCFAKDALPHDAVRVYLGDSGVLAMLPLERPGWWRTIGIGDAQREPPGVDRAVVESLIAQRSPLRLEVVDDDWYTAFRVREHVAQTYRRGRVLIAGDAAHAHSPLGGQGMNAGIQDAHNLAWKLALVMDDASQTLLDSYDAERRPIANDLVFATGNGTSALYISHPWAIWLRNRVVAGLLDNAAIEARLRRSLEMLDVGYRGSPIVDDYVDPTMRSLRRRIRNSGSVQPGERVPLHVEQLAELLDPDVFTAFIVAGHAVDVEVATQLARATAALGSHGHFRAVPVLGRPEFLAGRPDLLTMASGVLHDADGRVQRIFGIEERGIVVVRPDGYVGWRGEPLDLDQLGRWWTTTTGLEPPRAPAG